MKRRGLLIAAAFAVAVKLFTFEYAYTDDLTTGLGVRVVPSFRTHCVLPREEPIGPHRILTGDEMRYAGYGLYHLVVDGGWLVLGAAAIAKYAIRRRRRQ